MKKRQRIDIKHLDYWIIIPLIIMCTIGLIMVYSSSAGLTNNPITFLHKQLFFLFLGLVSMTLTFFMNLDWFSNKKLWYIFGIFIVLFIYLRSFGKSINGSAGWLLIGQFGIQPAEFVKFYLILAYSIFAANNVKNMENQWLKTNAKFSIILFSIFILVLMQPDLGGSTICLFTVLVMALTMLKNKFRAIAILLLFLLGIYIILLLVPLLKLNPNVYQFQRIIAFAHPFANVRGVGQQLVNSYYAFSNGGIFGVGLGNSIQKHGYLPEPNTDFIMAIVSEELGAITVISLMILLLIIIVRIVIIGMRSDNVQSVLFCYGVATFFFIEAFFNIGGVIGLLPITGVTFPFISYGGSSIITLSLCIGKVLRISYKQGVKRREGEGYIDN